MAQLRINKVVLAVLTFFIILTYLLFIRNNGEADLLKSIRNKPSISYQNNPQTNIRRPIDVNQRNKTSVASDLRLLESQALFNVNKSYIRKLESKKTNLLKTFDDHYKSILHSGKLYDPRFSNLTTNTYCECGRISEPCRCCANLTVNRFSSSNIHQSIYQPIVINSLNMNGSMAYCFSLQYKLFNNEAIFTSFLVDEERNSQRHLDSKFLRNSFLPTKKINIKLFSDQILKDIHKSYELCSRSNSSHIKLCIKLHSMDYRVDSGSESPETYFIACAHLMVKYETNYVIALYNFGCFQAHKGAIGDTDAQNKDFVIKPKPLKTKVIKGNVNKLDAVHDHQSPNQNENQ